MYRLTSNTFIGIADSWNRKPFISADEIKEEIVIKENEKKEKALNLVENIKKIEIKFTKEADEKDQLYGSISKKEILNFLIDKNVKVISDDIRILEPIRSIGEHKIEINPYEGIAETLTILVNKN